MAYSEEYTLEDLAAYQAGQLDQEERDRMTEHLKAGCSDCFALMKELYVLTEAMTDYYRQDCPSDEKIAAYVDGNLNAEEMPQVKYHIDKCPPCQAEEKELRRIVEMKGHESLFEPELLPQPAMVTEDLSFWQRFRTIYDSMRKSALKLHSLAEEVRKPIWRIFDIDWALYLEFQKQYLQTADVLARIREYKEPHYIGMLGAGDEGPDTIPFIYTALRRRKGLPKDAGFASSFCLLALTKIQWEKKGHESLDEQATEYEITLLNGYKQEELCPTIRCSNPELLWPEDIAVTEENLYEWQVRPIHAEKRTQEPWIRGLFWLLPKDKRNQLAEAERKCEEITDTTTREVALACLRAQVELYEEAISGLRKLIDAAPGDIKTIPARRALASIYKKVHETLLQGMGWEAKWMATRGNEEVKLIYCILLGKYKTYKRDECRTICKNQCGLID